MRKAEEVRARLQLGTPDELVGNPLGGGVLAMDAAVAVLAAHAESGAEGNEWRAAVAVGAFLAMVMALLGDGHHGRADVGRVRGCSGGGRDACFSPGALCVVGVGEPQSRRAPGARVRNVKE